MLNTLNDVLNNVDNFIWGMPLIILILFTGILLTVRLRGLQIRHLGKALHYVFHNEDDGEGEVTMFWLHYVRHFQQRSELVIS